MAKRGTGEGTVFQREDGFWVGCLSLGLDSNGKRQRKTVYGKTQAAVLQKLDDLKQQRKHGTKSIVGKYTLAGYLTGWLENDVALNKAEKTHQEYEQTVRLYITPCYRRPEAHKVEWRNAGILAGKTGSKRIHNQYAIEINPNPQKCSQQGREAEINPIQSDHGIG